jgi:hypothetical protein
VLPELKRVVAIAAAAEVEVSSAGDGGRIAGWRASRVVAIGLTCLAFGGTAMAATGVWDPGIGTETQSGPPTLSATPVPAPMTEALGVLRRAPDAQDRGPAVEATLGTIGSKSLAGVRLDSVRYLSAGANGEAAILFSQEGRWASSEEAEDHVCVYRPGPGAATVTGGEALPFCLGVKGILAGELWGELPNPDGSGVAFGLVPDGVASVTAKFGSGTERDIPVSDNYFEFSWDAAENAPSAKEFPYQMTWHGPDGSVVGKRSAGS